MRNDILEKNKCNSKEVDQKTEHLIKLPSMIEDELRAKIEDQKAETYTATPNPPPHNADSHASVQQRVFLYSAHMPPCHTPANLLY